MQMTPHATSVLHLHVFFDMDFLFILVYLCSTRNIWLQLLGHVGRGKINFTTFSWLAQNYMNDLKLEPCFGLKKLWCQLIETGSDRAPKWNGYYWNNSLSKSTMPTGIREITLSTKHLGQPIALPITPSLLFIASPHSLSSLLPLTNYSTN